MALKFDDIKHDKNKLLSMTSLTITEFTALSEVFSPIAERDLSARNLNWHMRKKAFSFKKSSAFQSYNDMLFFILSYLKTNPTQWAFATHNKMQQADVSRWVQRLEPLLTKALKKMKVAPETNGAKLKTVLKDSNEIYLDGTERPIPRPKNHQRQKAFYSGKKNDTPLKMLSLQTTNGS